MEFVPFAVGVTLGFILAQLVKVSVEMMWEAWFKR